MLGMTGVPTVSCLMNPPGRAASVAQEALNLLEAYLDIEEDILQPSTLRPKSAIQSRRSCAAILHETISVDNKLEKFNFKEPCRQQSVVSPSKAHCSLCGQSVPEGVNFPDRAKPIATCHSPVFESPQCGPTFEHVSSRPTDVPDGGGKGNSKYATQLLSTPSEMSGPSSPQELPISPSPFVPLCYTSAAEDDETSDTDKLEVVVERQESAISTSSSVEPQTSLTSDLTSRTPSCVRSSALFRASVSDAHVLRSRSMGSVTARAINFVRPTNLLEPTPVSENAAYGRCVSVPSAPKQLFRQSESKPSRWGRLSLFRHRKHTKVIGKVKSFGSLPFGVKASTPESQLEGHETSPSRYGAPRLSRGQAALSALNRLFPRRFKQDHDEPSTPYLSGGFSFLFGKHTFGPFRRKGLFGKLGVRTEPKVSEKLYPRATSTVCLEKAGDQVTPQQHSKDLFCNAAIPSGDCALSDTNSTAVWRSNSTLVATHEVTRIYQELIQTAEGDRLSASAAEVWRGVHHIPLSEQTNSLSNTATQEVDAPTIPRPHKPDLIRGNRMFHRSEETRFNGYNGLTKVSEVDYTMSPDQRSSDTSTESPSHLSDHNAPLPPARNNSSSVANGPSPVAEPLDTEPVPYTIVANMINALSQRIMNNITEEELERRLLMWEQRAAMVPNHPPGNPRFTPELHKQPTGLSLSTEHLVHQDLDVDKNHSRASNLRRINSARFPTEKRLLKHSMLAQARRLEHRKKLDVCVELLNRLVAHTNYPAFEADVLELLGRQPSWHQISILYYLARCAVRHLLNSHFAKLDSLNKLVEPMNKLNTFGHNASSVTHGDAAAPTTETQEPLSLTHLPTSTKLVALAEIGHCRASVERIKDFTVTFFFRWYADWVYARGGWQSVIEETDDSEVD